MKKKYDAPELSVVSLGSDVILTSGCISYDDGSGNEIPLIDQT